MDLGPVPHPVGAMMPQVPSLKTSSSVLHSLDLALNCLKWRAPSTAAEDRASLQCLRSGCWKQGRDTGRRVRAVGLKAGFLLCCTAVRPDLHAQWSFSMDSTEPHSGGFSDQQPPDSTKFALIQALHGRQTDFAEHGRTCIQVGNLATWGRGHVWVLVQHQIRCRHPKSVAVVQHGHTLAARMQNVSEKRCLGLFGS